MARVLQSAKKPVSDRNLGKKKKSKKNKEQDHVIDDVDVDPVAEVRVLLKPGKHHGRALKRTILLFFENDGMLAAGNMAFLAMLSLFPFIIFLTSLSGFFGQTEAGYGAINLMLENLPEEVANTLKGPINGIVNNAGAELLTGSIIFAVWTAANGIEAARGVLIKAFGKEHARAIWMRRLESLGIVVFSASMLLIAMSILVLGPAILKALLSYTPDEIHRQIRTIWNYLSLLLSPAFMFFGIYALFLALTPRKVKKPYRLPGTLLCLTFFLVTAKGLSVYLKYANNYDVTYGSLAGIVVTQLFCFLISLGFILGGEMNAAYTQLRKEGLEPKDD